MPDEKRNAEFSSKEGAVKYKDDGRIKIITSIMIHDEPFLFFSVLKVLSRNDLG